MLKVLKFFQSPKGKIAFIFLLGSSFAVASVLAKTTDQGFVDARKVAPESLIDQAVNENYHSPLGTIYPKVFRLRAGKELFVFDFNTQELCGVAGCLYAVYTRDLIGRGEGGREQGEQALPLCRGAQRNMGIKPRHKRTLEQGRSTSSIPASPLPPSPCSPASGSEGQKLLSLYLRSELPNKTTKLLAVDGTENGFPCLKTAQFDEKNNKIVATRYCVQGKTLIPVFYQLLEVTH